MSKLPDLSSAIHFLKLGSGEGGETAGNFASAASAQTGDLIGIILAIIAAISVIHSLYGHNHVVSKSSTTYSWFSKISNILIY